MKHASKLMMICLTALGGAVLLSGCKVSKCTGPDGGPTEADCLTIQPPKKYVGKNPFTGSAPWSSGKSVTINNGNGDVVVDATGTATELSASAIPFAFNSPDATGEQAAITTMQNMVLTVAADPAGSVAVSGNGTGAHGFTLTVHLPSTFDGALTVAGPSGSVTVTTVATSPSTTVTGSAGPIVVNGAVGHLSINGKANDITVSATPSGPGNVIKTDNGAITASIGANANLTISATCDLGVVTPAAGMNANVSADKAMATITMGDGSGALAVQSGLGDITFR
jgi:hypothetical protein